MSHKNLLDMIVHNGELGPKPAVLDDAALDEVETIKAIFSNPGATMGAVAGAAMRLHQIAPGYTLSEIEQERLNSVLVVLEIASQRIHRLETAIAELTGEQLPPKRVLH